MIFNAPSVTTGGTLTVTAPANVTVTISKDGKTKAKNSGTSGVAVFKGLASGTWTVTITGDGKTAQKNAVVTTDYSMAISFFSATINVTYPAGSTCTATDGVTTLTAPDTSGVWVCVVPNAGIWTVACVDGSKASTAQVTISADGQTNSISLAYTYIVFDGGNSADYSGEWNGTGSNTSDRLNMRVNHGLYNGSYFDAGWKGTTGKIRVPSGASVMKMTYSTTGQWGDLANRLFGLRSTPYAGFESGSSKYVSYAEVPAGTNATVSLSITDAVAGNDYYVGIQGDSGYKNIATNAAISISKIWIE